MGLTDGGGGEVVTFKVEGWGTATHQQQVLALIVDPVPVCNNRPKLLFKVGGVGHRTTHHGLGSMVGPV